MENNLLEQRLQKHIEDDYKIHLEITNKLTEVSTKLAIASSLPSFIIVLFELIRFFVHNK
ncbi:MAG TPA: hypothetical protein DCM02_08575 [Flavobacterium sp.]|nr:hypothetical protein [Flavobacterium sp.]